MNAFRAAVEAKLGRMRGQSAEAKAYVEQETKDVIWWAIDRRTGEVVKGTKEELVGEKPNG
jgi:hypothetical protein